MRNYWGYPELILASRKTNDNMVFFARKIVKRLIKNGKLRPEQGLGIKFSFKRKLFGYSKHKNNRLDWGAQRIWS